MHQQMRLLSTAIKPEKFLILSYFHLYTIKIKNNINNNEKINLQKDAVRQNTETFCKQLINHSYSIALGTSEYCCLMIIFTYSIKWFY